MACDVATSGASDHWDSEEIVAVDLWPHLQGIQEEMMNVLLQHTSIISGACAAVCTKRLQHLHTEMLRTANEESRRRRSSELSEAPSDGTRRTSFFDLAMGPEEDDGAFEDSTHLEQMYGSLSPTGFQSNVSPIKGIGLPSGVESAAGNFWSEPDPGLEAHRPTSAACTTSGGDESSLAVDIASFQAIEVTSVNESASCSTKVVELAEESVKHGRDQNEGIVEFLSTAPFGHSTSTVEQAALNQDWLCNITCPTVDEGTLEKDQGNADVDLSDSTSFDKAGKVETHRMTLDASDPLNDLFGFDSGVDLGDELLERSNMQEFGAKSDPIEATPPHVPLPIFDECPVQDPAEPFSPGHGVLSRSEQKWVRSQRSRDPSPPELDENSASYKMMKKLEARRLKIEGDPLDTDPTQPMDASSRPCSIRDSNIPTWRAYSHAPPSPSSPSSGTSRQSGKDNVEVSVTMEADLVIPGMDPARNQESLHACSGLSPWDGYSTVAPNMPGSQKEVEENVLVSANDQNVLEACSSGGNVDSPEMHCTDNDAEATLANEACLDVDKRGAPGMQPTLQSSNDSGSTPGQHLDLMDMDSKAADSWNPAKDQEALEADAVVYNRESVAALAAEEKVTKALKEVTKALAGKDSMEALDMGLSQKEERKAEKDAEQLAKLVEERQAKDNAERLAKEEEERKAKEEAERLAKEEEERKAKEEAERLAKEEEERKAKEEAERLAKEEEERKAKEEAERLEKEEEERKAKEEAERRAKEEEERKAQAEAKHLAKEEEDASTDGGWRRTRGVFSKPKEISESGIMSKGNVNTCRGPDEVKCLASDSADYAKSASIIHVTTSSSSLAASEYGEYQDQQRSEDGVSTGAGTESCSFIGEKVTELEGEWSDSETSSVTLVPDASGLSNLISTDGSVRITHNSGDAWTADFGSYSVLLQLKNGNELVFFNGQRWTRCGNSAKTETCIDKDASTAVRDGPQGLQGVWRDEHDTKWTLVPSAQVGSSEAFVSTGGGVSFSRQSEDNIWTANFGTYSVLMRMQGHDTLVFFNGQRWTRF